MGTLTLKFKQNLGDILKGDKTTNLRIQYMWWGTNSAAESENHTDLQTALAGSRRLASLIARVNKDFVIGDFVPAGTFTNGTVLREVGIFWEPQSGGDMVARHVGAGLPITIDANKDIRIDVTVTNEQG